MPIEQTITYNLTAVERAAIGELKAEEQTAEEYLQVNSTTPEQLEAITANFVRHQTEEQFAPIGRAIVEAAIARPEVMPAVLAKVDEIKVLLGLEGTAPEE